MWRAGGARRRREESGVYLVEANHAVVVEVRHVGEAHEDLLTHLR